MAKMTERQSTQLKLWRQISSLWHRTDRARSLAQVPIVALGPGAGPVANQVRLAASADSTVIRREADLELQKQWAHNELLRLEDGPGYVVREDPGDRKAAENRTSRDYAEHEHGR